MNERILLEEHPSMFRSQPLLFIFGLLLSPFIIGIVILVLMYLRCLGERIVVTEDTLLVERGLLSKNRTESLLSGIRSINIDQSFLDRILGVGKISIYTTGDEPEAVIAGIRGPHRVRDAVRASQRRNREVEA